MKSYRNEIVSEWKKRKINFECHAFKAHWSVHYFIIELDGNILFILEWL